MDHMIYLAMSGAKQTMHRQATNNHNLANVSTTGFRADLDAFRSLPVHGPGHPSRVYVSDERAGVDFSPGQIVHTGRNLDVAISGDGFIAVQAPDGSEAYTRAGDLRITSAGLLETGTGLPVKGNGGPIAISPYERMEIGSDGTITIQPVGQQATALAVLDRIKLVKPKITELEKADDGLLRLQSGDVAPADAAVTLVTGSIESSNVNSVDALVNMISLSRQYEMQVKMMKTAEENDAASARLMRMS